MLILRNNVVMLFSTRFGRLNFIDPISVTDVSGITGHETGHLTGASGIAADISGSFNKGFELTYNPTSNNRIN